MTIIMCLLRNNIYAIFIGKDSDFGLFYRDQDNHQRVDKYIFSVAFTMLHIFVHEYGALNDGYGYVLHDLI